MFLIALTASPDRWQPPNLVTVIPMQRPSCTTLLSFECGAIKWVEKKDVPK